ncbi:MAG: hypothetical protein FWG37_04160, partial [Clostridia bacterium]|nr:hypothetical protein [Clostridia bacterium]
MAGDEKRSGVWKAVCLLCFVLIPLVPAVVSVLLSLKSYVSPENFMDSAWSGVDNFVRFLRAEERARIIENSVLYGAGGFVFSLVFGTAIALYIPRIRSHKARGAALSLLLFPLFIPSVCLASGILSKVAGKGTATELYALLTQAMLGASVVGFAGAAYEIAMPGRGFLRGIGWASFLYAFLLLTPDSSLLSHITSPENGVSLQVLDTAAMDAVASAGEYSYGAALFALKSGVQLLAGIIVGIGAYGLFLRGRKAPLDSVSRGNREIPFWNWFAAVTPLICVCIIAFSPRMSWEAGIPLPDVSKQILFSAGAGLLAYALSLGIIYMLRGSGYILFMLVSGVLLAFSNPVIGL